VVVSHLLESPQSLWCRYTTVLLGREFQDFEPATEGTADILPSQDGEWLGGEHPGGGVPRYLLPLSF